MGDPSPPPKSLRLSQRCQGRRPPSMGLEEFRAKLGDIWVPCPAMRRV